MKIRNPLKKKEVKKEEVGQKEVEYQPLGDNAYHVKANIESERFDIIAYGYPAEKKVDTKGSAGLSLEGVKAEGQQDKQVKGFWDAIVKTEEYGYLPIETWKKITQKVAETLSIATGSTVTSSDIKVYSSAPISTVTKCPKCGTPILINLGICQVCGTRLD
jgi:hypothetical protein